MTTTIQTLEDQLKALESEHAASLLTGNIGAATDLERKIQPLADLLGAPERKAAAQRDLQALRDQADQAQAVADQTLTVVTRLQAQRDDAAAEYQAARDHTAGVILAAAKEGKAVTPLTPDRQPVLALESALSLAVAEHQAAVDALNAVQAQATAAEKALQQAECDCARLIFELALRTFAGEARTALIALPDYSITYMLNDVHSAIYAEV